jgi:hypothetical protein
MSDGEELGEQNELGPGSLGITWKPGNRRGLVVFVKEGILPMRGITDCVNKLMNCGDVLRIDFTSLFRARKRSFTVIYYDMRAAQHGLLSLQKTVFVKAIMREVSISNLRGDTVSIPVGLAQSLFNAELVTGILDIIFEHMSRFGDVSTVELHHSGSFAEITYYDPRAILSIPFIEFSRQHNL